MKKRTILPMALAVVALGVAAGELDLQSRAQLRRWKLEQAQGKLSLELRQLRSKGAQAAEAAGTPQETLAFVTLADGASRADLEAEGMEVMTVRGDIAIVKLPVADVERMAASKAVRTMQLQRELDAHLDLARQDTGVDDIHSGSEGLPQAYTGKGVMAAIADQGVWPHHINFLDGEGNDRVKMLANVGVNTMGNVVTQFYGDPADIDDALPLVQFQTDAQSAYHGTHTLGIMAGGYKGDVEISEGLNGTTPIITKKANPYYGVATDADISVSCGYLTDACVALGMDYMYGFAQYREQPLVYNLSLGSNAGPHDTNSTISRFFDMLGQESIICLSAGNEGDLKIALNKTFTEDDNQIKSFIYPYSYQYDPSGDPDDTFNNTIRYGQIVFYSDDDTPFDIQAVVYNSNRNYRAAARFNISDAGENGMYWCTNDDFASQVSGTVYPGTFADNFYGYIGGGAMVDSDTGRYYAMIDFYLYDYGNNRESGQYKIGFEITGQAGQRVDCYADGGGTIQISDCGIEGFDDGSCNGSISDMAVAHNIIVVGSYNTRQEWYSLDGYQSSYQGEGYAPGLVSPFSSFGTLSDGRNLPTVCAPGSAIISSMSNPYLDYVASSNGYNSEIAQMYNDYLCQARATVDGETYYWKQELGTSMSTPFVAGSIALWLEADPTLTVDDVREIITSTAVVDEAVEAGDPVQWGAGKFDALAGLKEVIRRSSGVEGVGVDSRNDRLMVTPAGDRLFNVFLGDATELDVKLYAMSGACVRSISVSGDEATVDLSDVEGGIYVLSVNGHTQKLAVR